MKGRAWKVVLEDWPIDTIGIVRKRSSMVLSIQSEATTPATATSATATSATATATSAVAAATGLSLSLVNLVSVLVETGACHTVAS